MRQVVEDEQGTGHYRYRMDDVDIIAKTGTGQIANEHGEYGDIYTMSVMAAAPAQDPKVMVYYVFEGHDYLNYSGEPFKETMKAALVACNISNQNEQISEEKEEVVKFEQYNMPNVVNHSLEYATKKLEGMNVEVITVGDGTTIIDQYPSEGSNVIAGNRIFLLSDGGNIKMPNMKYWTKKDITAFWKMSGIQVLVEGSGKVVSQNIPTDSIISKNDEIEVVME